MHYIIQAKDYDGFGQPLGEATNGELRVHTIHSASDKLSLCKEIYNDNDDNIPYEAYEYIHEYHTKEKMIINGREHHVNFVSGCSKFRVFR